MSNSDEFIPTAEQKEFLDQMYTTFYVLINNATGLSPGQLSDDVKANEIFEKVEIYGYVLAKLQGYYNIEPDYLAYSEFDEFPTLADAFNYIAGRAMVEEGLLTSEDL